MQTMTKVITTHIEQPPAPDLRKQIKQPKSFDKANKKFDDWQKLVRKGGFQPFLKVHQVNKVSRRHLHFYSPQQRTAHYLSDGEFRTAKGLAWLPEVETIEEQYPLDPRVTLAIAIDQNFIHPRIWETNEGVVMTTDFLVHFFPSTKLRPVAYSFKYWDQIYNVQDGETIEKNWRTWQKFKIEQLYWNQRNVDFEVITERTFPKVVINNIEWFRIAAKFEFTNDQIKIFKDVFIWEWSKAYYKILHVLLSNVAKALKIEFIDADKLFRFCCYHQIITLNLYTPVAHQNPVELYV